MAMAAAHKWCSLFFERKIVQHFQNLVYDNKYGKHFLCAFSFWNKVHGFRFKKTSKTITKQKIDISVEVHLTEYHADVYYNSKTGERIHAPFPQGVIDDVNYGGNLRAFLFLLNNDCCTSIDKSRRFLSDLTDGKINISKGMINNLCRSFARQTECQCKEIPCDMLLPLLCIQTVPMPV